MYRYNTRRRTCSSSQQTAMPARSRPAHRQQRRMLLFLRMLSSRARAPASREVLLLHELQRPRPDAVRGFGALRWGAGGLRARGGRARSAAAFDHDASPWRSWAGAPLLTRAARVGDTVAEPSSASTRRFSTALPCACVPWSTNLQKSVWQEALRHAACTTVSGGARSESRAWTMLPGVGEKATLVQVSSARALTRALGWAAARASEAFVD